MMLILPGSIHREDHCRYKNIPTICLDISGYDMLRAVIECQKLFHPGKIAICGFESRLFEAEEICRMVGVNAAVFAPVLHDDLEKTMERILASGCDAVVGDIRPVSWQSTANPVGGHKTGPGYGGPGCG